MTEVAPLASLLPAPEEADADRLLEAFLQYVEELGVTLYPAQEEAILELFSGANVILNTPTGSGKSLVAEAMHFRALARDEVSFYTAPIKALVSEKFFALCRVFGADNVGMLTGDASVNGDAPILCCTTEILANLALRLGTEADLQHIALDEFHYYSDRDRGWAWQVPLLELPQARFLLMSATLGDTRFLQQALEDLTRQPARLVQSQHRPVPLDFSYRETPLHETITELLETGRAPVYIVHFSQRAAAEQAQSLMSVDFLSKADKQEIKRELAGFRFDTPYGAELRRFVHHGIGVHHAGLLPRYRRMVERLAQKGHLKLVCGTDTLGVGVNIPIRTVLFTKLGKFDGQQTRVLSVRDFKQIAGRAGRKGFDELGSVVVQAPEHVIENRTLRQKAEGNPKKMRKVVWRKPPDRGYVHYDEETLERLRKSEPEALESSFDVNHAMLLHLLRRPGDGCSAIKHLIRNCHERPWLRRQHGRRAVALFRSLLSADVVQILAEPDDEGRFVRLNDHLQTDFSLNQALALWVVETTGELDPESDDYTLTVVSLVEAVQENPMAVLIKQMDKAKQELLRELKAQGMEYEDRMAELERVEWPKPCRDTIYDAYNRFAEHNPWVGENIRPKSIVRDMWEMGCGFREYVKEYGLQRSEGVLLRYLSDAYRALTRTVPEQAKSEELQDIIAWLEAIVRRTDASLLEEWERLQDPAALAQQPIHEPAHEEAVSDITRSPRELTLLLRNALFRFVRYLQRGEYEKLVDECETPPGHDGRSYFTARRLEELMQLYWQQYDALRTDADARSAKWLRIQVGPEAWHASQSLLDPDDHAEWHLDVVMNLARTREQQRPVLELVYLGEGDGT